jgi:uncharacterized membrane protein
MVSSNSSYTFYGTMSITISCSTAMATLSSLSSEKKKKEIIFVLTTSFLCVWIESIVYRFFGMHRTRSYALK